MAVARTRNPLIRIALILAGVFLILLTPIVGPIPGPGGIIVFAGGLVLILQNSEGARKHFVRAKRRWPRLGHYADMALRRRSFRRRRARDKEAALAAAEAEAAGFTDSAR